MDFSAINVEILTAALGGAGVWKAGELLLNFRSDSRKANTEAIASLTQSLAEMRSDIDRLRHELGEERKLREKAEAEVSILRRHIRVMAGVMQEKHIPVPNLPGID